MTPQPTKTSRPYFFILLAACLTPLLGPSAAAASPEVERGRYLSVIAGCNDCHTAGYLQANGSVPEKNWLMGDRLGWHGPWGTTYAPNLRLYMAQLTEDDWVTLARQMQPRPPMPWFNLRQMTEGDLRAIYKFVRALGPVGEPAPDFLPPDKTPPPPYVQMP